MRPSPRPLATFAVTAVAAVATAFAAVATAVATAVAGASLLAGAAGAARSAAASSEASAAARVVGPAGPLHLDGLETGPTPWPAEWPHLAQRLRAIGLPALDAEGEVVHIHQHLDVRVNGRAVVVPAGLGFGIGSDGKTVKFISPLHTHDTAGIIHVESPIRRDFTLGDVFDVWGLRFSASCLGGYCNRGAARVRVFVNGRLVGPGSGPRDVVLAPHQQILVSFGSAGQLPARIARTFAFEPGL